MNTDHNRRARFERIYPVPEGVMFNPNLGIDGSYQHSGGAIENHANAIKQDLLWQGWCSAHGIMAEPVNYVPIGRVEPMLQINWHTRETKGVALVKDGLKPGTVVYACQPEWAAGTGPVRQYFYKIDGCPATHADNPRCICWHEAGTGPLAHDRSIKKEWRIKPGTRHE